MFSKSYTVVLLTSLIGSTLCVIPDGEIQIGPIFGGSRFFGGHKHFEAVFEKGAQLKPLLAKKALLGVGVLGAGALAAGGAALLAKKFPHLHQGWGWSGGQSGGYAQGHYNNYHSVPVSNGWGNGGGYYQGGSDVKFPATAGYPASSYYDNNQYAPPATEYGYPQGGEWQGSSGGYGGAYGWSR